MTEKLDEILNDLKTTPLPEPTRAMKDAAIGRAMAAFDEKYSASAQGIRFADRLNMDRLKIMGRALFETLSGERSMKHKYLLGGLGVSALAIVVVGKTYWPSEGPGPVSFSVSQEENKNAKVVDPSKAKDAASAPAAEPQAVPPQAGPTQPSAHQSASNQVAAPPPATLGEAQRGFEFEQGVLAGRDRAEEKVAEGESAIAGWSQGDIKKGSDLERLKQEKAGLNGESQVYGGQRAPLLKEGLVTASPSTPPSDGLQFHGRGRANFDARTSTEWGSANVAGAPPSPVKPMPMASPMERRQDGLVDAKRRSPFDPPAHPPYYQEEGRDRFPEVKDNPVKSVKVEPVSTFSIDVDTSSYSFLRAALNSNAKPPRDAIRIEELINYFPYDYEVPKDKSEPFKATTSVFPSPWNANTQLVHIGIKGYQLENQEKPHSNLVFLIDTSGSMNAPNKLPLVKNSMKLLLDTLKADDTISLVTYAGSAGVALEPTKVKDKRKILNALDKLESGGSTAGAEGIRTAYRLAEDNFDKDGVNRVILATDGDFNVGITDPGELKTYIEKKRKTGIFLSVLGFGQGNYNDTLMQTLAQNGNGNAAYIDNLNEARKALVEEASSTLFPIAKDVKIQIEFNPALIAEYRLIGYETRMLNREDFNNDKVDAGDIGAGHTVTAIYEITPVGSPSRLADDLRYQTPDVKPDTPKPEAVASSEYAFLKIRYKLPDSDTSKLITQPIDAEREVKEVAQASTEARFATAVAAFGQLLRGDSFTKSFGYDEVIALAQGAKGEDKFGYRAEFLSLARLAKSAASVDQDEE